VDAEVVLAIVFWTLCLARVVAAALRHETFGAEATLALIAVLGLPMATLGRGHSSAT
jgi:hypothetical protein